MLGEPQRFWSKVTKQGECWVWTAGKRRGYGSFKINGIDSYAHRVAWELHRGEIPTGLDVLHTCDNPSCVRLSHLFLGTDKENAADREAKKRGHDRRGEKNGKAKLTVEQVIAIRRSTGSHRKIAAHFGVSDVMIGLIRNGKSWTHL